MLSGARLTLREWREPDLPTLAALRNDLQLQALLMARARPNSIERVRNWLTDRSASDDMLFFVVASAGDDSVLGYVQVANIDRISGTGELGICLSRGAQGVGLAAECCDLLEVHAQTVYALRKFTLRVLATNRRAIAFYHKRGYRDAGRFERHFLVDGEYQDVILMERFLAG